MGFLLTLSFWFFFVCVCNGFRFNLHFLLYRGLVSRKQTFPEDYIFDTLFPLSPHDVAFQMLLYFLEHPSVKLIFEALRIAKPWN